MSRILIRRDVGLSWSRGKPDSNDIRLDSGHPFRDYTDTPAPTIGSRIVDIVSTDDRQPMTRKGKAVDVNAPSPSVLTHGRPHTHSELTLPTVIESSMSREDKPPYRVPLMSEIAALPPNGYTIVSTFSGCGGSCLGFKMDGYRVAWASEFIPAAQDTYRANHPGTYLDTRDIRTVTADDIIRQTGIPRGEIDVLEGSPPCASFSTAGKREAGWGKVKAYSDTKQRVDDLFFEYARLVRDLQPRVFVAENVSGLVKGTAKGYFKLILAELKAAGYQVEARLLDAQWLGVPQMRQRIIFIGVRNDLGLKPAFPKPLPYRYSVREALPWIIEHASNESYEQVWRDSSRHSAPVITAGPNDKIHVVEAETDISRYAIGAEWNKLQPGEQSAKYRSLVKPALDQPSPTVTCPPGAQFSQTAPSGSASVVHPTERRKFTIAELKRICAFPDDFILTGSYAQQWERLGRAVPPVMMYHVARTVRTEILERL